VAIDKARTAALFSGPPRRSRMRWQGAEILYAFCACKEVVRWKAEFR